MKSVIFNKEKVVPSKILCIARNYMDHIREMGNAVPGEPVFFIKPNSSICEEVFVPPWKCRYEAEISFMVKDGKFCALAFGLDLTLSEVQNKLKDKGFPWEKCKAFDRSAVFSEFVPFSCDLSNLKLEFYVNGELRQIGKSELMTYKPLFIFEEMKKFFTFEDYDILMTGTPEGVGDVFPGDKYAGKILAGEKLLVEKEWIVRK